MPAHATTAPTTEVPAPRAPRAVLEDRDSFRSRVAAMPEEERRSAGRLRALNVHAEQVSEVVRQEERDLLKTLTGLSVRDFDRLCPAATLHGTAQAGEDGDEEAPAPAHTLPMSDSGWAFSLGDGTDTYARGVYRQGGKSWRRVADLPHCHGRIVRRDGGGVRRATDYLLSATEEGPRVVLSRDTLKDGSGAGPLGISLPTDRKVVDAWGTAVDAMAFLPGVEEREAVPRITEAEEITVPVPECLPNGYLTTTSLSREEALTRWREEVVPELAQCPAAATMYGASAGGVFLEAVGAHPHIVDAFGDSDAGKTTTVQGCASVWGDSRKEKAGTFRSWNATGKGPLRFLGQLGLLPAFMDERGMANFDPAEWGNLIYCLTSGLQRMAATARDQYGLNTGLPWTGLLVTSGNGRLLHKIENGKWDGCPKRVIEVTGPFTLSARQAERVREATTATYGHVGAAILERFTVADARKLYAAVWESEVSPGEPLLPLPEGGNARTWAKELAVHVMGAWMVDLILGTGTMLRDAAAAFGRQYLEDRTAERKHDADVLMEAILQAMASESSKWPTRAEYRAMQGTGDFSSPDFTPVRRHGVDRTLSGVVDDDGQWVAVFPRVLHALAEELEVDESRAFRELYGRKLMAVTASRRKRGDWQTPVKLGEGKARQAIVYKFILPEVTEEEGPEEGQEGDGGNGGGPERPAVCRGCGGTMTLDDGTGYHPGCDPGTVSGFGAGTIGAEEWAKANTPTPPQTLPQEEVPPRRWRRGEVIPADGGKPDETPAREERTFSRRDQEEAFRARVAVLDAMDPADDSDEAITRGATDLRIIEAMTEDPGGDKAKDGPFSPVKYGSAAPFWTAPLPDIAPPMVAYTGWGTWTSASNYRGPAAVLDRNAGHPSALSSLRVAHGPLKPTGALPNAKRPGYYKTVVHPWSRTDLPSPMGTREAGAEVWVTHERMRLLEELANLGPEWWPDATILDSRTAERETSLRDLSQLIKHLRAHVINTHGKDSPQWEAVKEATNTKLIQILMGSPKSTGTLDRWTERTWHTKCHRTDWAHALHDKAAMNLYRVAMKLTGGRVPVLAVRHMDEIVIPAGEVRGALGRGLIRADESGRTFGTFKTKDTEEWGAE